MSSTAVGGQSGTLTTRISDPGYFPARPLVRIHLLGSMRATSFLGDDALPRAKKARAALGYLCLTPGSRVSRTRMATLWLFDRIYGRRPRYICNVVFISSDARFIAWPRRPFGRQYGSRTRGPRRDS